MTAIEIARRFAQLEQKSDALNAYTLALQMNNAQPPEQLEAACYLLENGGDSRLSMTCLINLYQQGFCREDIFPLVLQLFYRPHEKEFQKRYEANLELLSDYPYLFRKDFLSFENLPVRFLPYDEHGGYVPFVPSEKRFDPFVNVRDTIISRNFFKDLEKPVLADDVYSQYELEYLRDNVRPSEYIARENHIYLHYTDWALFCSWLQTLDFTRLLEQEKIVFLMEEEIGRYPIDFKASFGIDYSQYPVRHVGVREVTKLIWHAQLSSSNGGDFFNEVFDYHPNLLIYPSVMFDSILENIEEHREFLRTCSGLKEALTRLKKWRAPWVVKDLYRLKNRTQKDILVAFFLYYTKTYGNLDEQSRIVPALFFQPHFHHIHAGFSRNNKTGETVLETEELDKIHETPLFNEFPYIKTFTPLRRFTTTYGSTLRFMDKQMQEEGSVKIGIGRDMATDRMLNRTFMRDPEDRFYRDSVIVRFEDGKLNPEATFTKLAAFLDLPYTESMTYCSQNGVHDVETAEGNAIGFDPVTVYKTYDDYCGKPECSYMEYFLRDAYRFYGYDFHYYDGEPVDEQRCADWVTHFDTQDQLYRNVWNMTFDEKDIIDNPGNLSLEQISRLYLEAFLESARKERLEIVKGLQNQPLRFVNKRGQPLEMTPMLQPDPALLVQPLYH